MSAQCVCGGGNVYQAETLERGQQVLRKVRRKTVCVPGQFLRTGPSGTGGSYPASEVALWGRGDDLE